MINYMKKFENYNFQRKKLNKYASTLFNLSAKAKIKKAINFAAKNHHGQLHSNGSPYIIHPLRVALILIEEIKIKNINLICAAILHDVIEDCPITYKKLEKLFGKTIANLVLGVTRVRDKNETEKEKAKNKIAKIKKIAKAKKQIKLLKLCDVLDSRRSETLIPKKSPLFKKIPRWHREFKLYRSIAEQTNKKIAQIFREISK